MRSRSDNHLVQICKKFYVVFRLKIFYYYRIMGSLSMIVSEDIMMFRGVINGTRIRTRKGII